MDAPHQPTSTTTLDRIALIANQIGAAALFGVVLVQAWQVFARYVLNASPSWTEPAAMILLSTTMSLGAAVMVRRQAHFGFVLARDAAPPAIRLALTAAIDLVIAGLGIALGFWAAQLLVDGWNVPLAGIGLPQSTPYLPLAVGGVLIAIFAVDALRCRLKIGAPES